MTDPKQFEKVSEKLIKPISINQTITQSSSWKLTLSPIEIWFVSPLVLYHYTRQGKQID